MIGRRCKRSNGLSQPILMIRTVCFICFRSPFSYFSATLASPYVKLFFPSRGLPRRRPRRIGQSRINTLVTIGEGKHTFPSRTRSLSPRPPMVVRPLLSCESRSSPVLWPAHSERRERVFFLDIAFRSFTWLAEYGLIND